jgi:hypothetical protein
MNQDEVNNLLSVMQKKISELTTQNIMLEAKIIYLNNVITSMQKQSTQSDFDESEYVENSSKSKR